MSVVIETTLGDVTIDLLTKERPKTCYNFLKLCKLKYYNFCLLHHVEKDFIAQTGDPTGTGNGGYCVFHLLDPKVGRFFQPETTPKIKHNRLGTVSMVNNGDGLHGSQFFITLSEDLDYLDGIHTVFGYVVEGLEVLSQLNHVLCGEDKKPYKDILITHTVILDDPFDDPDIEMPESPLPNEDILESDRIGVAEDLNDEDLQNEDIEEKIREKEAKAQATILEMVGDIPDADIKPPENVLFVCKLNPVTKEEDLEVIFSRFGPINSCEVIKDSKTNESLQYAFIEFENVADCEKAYFKMDNVVIDDRRIHVDFSQSVSKLKWSMRRKMLKGTKKADEIRKKSKKHTSTSSDESYNKNRSKSRSSSRSSSLKRRKKKDSKNERLEREHRESDRRDYRSDNRRSEHSSRREERRDNRSYKHRDERHGDSRRDSCRERESRRQSRRRDERFESRRDDRRDNRRERRDDRRDDRRYERRDDRRDERRDDRRESRKDERNRRNEKRTRESRRI